MALGILQQPWPRTPTENQTMHMERISEACELLRSYMHEGEGSQMPGPVDEHHWQKRRMKLAADHLEIAEMMARKGVLE
jgi:hypothetical protein